MVNPTADLRFVPLGIGHFFSRQYYHTSFLVVAGDRRFLIDCPSPICKMLNEASLTSGLTLGLEGVDDVILTHLHGDHVNGLEEVAFYKRFVERAGPPRLYTMAEVAGPLWDHRLQASLGVVADLRRHTTEAQALSDWFAVHLVDEGESFECCGVKVEIRRTRHFLPCFGMRLTYGGCRLGYSGDTVFEPMHVDFLSDCDVIVHECEEGEGHTPLHPLLALPVGIRRKMFLTHISDAYDGTSSPIPVLEQGRCYSVGLLKERLSVES